MAIAGLLLTIAGFLLSVLSLSLTASVTGRLIFVCAGIVLSLVGIIGLLNRACLSKAIWRKA